MEQSYMISQICNAAVTPSAHRWMNHPQGHVSQRILEDFDILYTHAGRYEVAADRNTVYPCRAGDILIFPPGSMLQVTALQPSQQFFCHFLLTASNGLSLGAHFREHRLPAACKDLVPLYRRLALACGNDSLPPDFFLAVKLLMVGMLKASPENRLFFRDGMARQLPEDLQNALNRIHNFREKVTTEQLASDAGYNPVYFSRYFKKYMGETPAAYSARYRMDFARELVASTPQSVREIAETLGFNDPFAFSKQFKKRFGMSPSDFRKTNT